MKEKLLSTTEASQWATNYTGKNITPSNISYLIQYGRIKKFGNNGTTQVSEADLIEYYKEYSISRETFFKEKLGDNLN